MASNKYGTKTPQWWKHLKEYKRVFWKAHRKAEKAHCAAHEDFQKPKERAPR